jgi:pimeloyl-ACP methyl ester carboxylesterase
MIRNYLTVEDGRIFYTVVGNGEPIVLLHGNFNDHRIWSEQIDALSRDHKLVLCDLRGYGLSSTPKASFSNVDDLKALVDALKLHSLTLIGSSSGGGVAIDFALTYPHLIRALILVSPSVNGNRSPLSMTWQGIRNYINVRTKGHQAAIESFIANRFWQYFFPPLRKEEARSNVLRNVRNESNFCRFSPTLPVAIRPYAIRRLGEIRIPTLIVTSDREHPFNIRTAETLHASLRLSTKTIMRDCGHIPFVEEPHEFNRRVLDFISTTGSGKQENSSVQRQ